MERIHNLGNAQEFVDEYEIILDKLQDLFDTIGNKELKEEVNGLISVFEEDYKEAYESSNNLLLNAEQEELTALNEGYERSRI